MFHPIHATTRMEAWALGADAVRRYGKDSNIVLGIAEPWRDTEADLAAMTALDAHYTASIKPQHRGKPLNVGGQQLISTVADTIFPSTYYQRYGPEDFYEAYLADIPSLRQVRSGSNWGTYAQRFMSYRDAEWNYQTHPKSKEQINPLREIVRKMQNSRANGTHLHNCYELPVYRPDLDHSRTRGQPCLSHVSIKVLGDAVHLTAQYRNQDYRFKLPGNLLGLARLQDFLATQSGLKNGSLTIHAVSAFVDSLPGKREFNEIVAARLNAIHG